MSNKCTKKCCECDDGGIYQHPGDIITPKQTIYYCENPSIMYLLGEQWKTMTKEEFEAENDCWYFDPKVTPPPKRFKWS